MADTKNKSNPECSMEMVYSKNLDLWALDIRLNKPFEKLLGEYRLADVKQYQLVDGKVRKRYSFASGFVGSYAEKSKPEQRILCALFDTEKWGSGKRLSIAPDYKDGMAQMTYAKDLFKVLAKHSAVMTRKVVASIRLEPERKNA